MEDTDLSNSALVWIVVGGFAAVLQLASITVVLLERDKSVASFLVTLLASRLGYCCIVVPLWVSRGALSGDTSTWTRGVCSLFISLALLFQAVDLFAVLVLVIFTSCALQSRHAYAQVIVQVLLWLVWILILGYLHMDEYFSDQFLTQPNECFIYVNNTDKSVESLIVFSVLIASLLVLLLLTRMLYVQANLKLQLHSLYCQYRKPPKSTRSTSGNSQSNPSLKRGEISVTNNSVTEQSVTKSDQNGIGTAYACKKVQVSAGHMTMCCRVLIQTKDVRNVTMSLVLQTVLMNIAPQLVMYSWYLATTNADPAIVHVCLMSVAVLHCCTMPLSFYVSSVSYRLTVRRHITRLCTGDVATDENESTASNADEHMSTPPINSHHGNAINQQSHLLAVTNNGNISTTSVIVHNSDAARTSAVHAESSIAQTALNENEADEPSSVIENEACKQSRLIKNEAGNESAVTESEAVWQLLPQINGKHRTPTYNLTLQDQVVMFHSDSEKQVVKTKSMSLNAIEKSGGMIQTGTNESRGFEISATQGNGGVNVYGSSGADRVIELPNLQNLPVHGHPRYISEMENPPETEKDKIKLGDTIDDQYAFKRDDRQDVQKYVCTLLQVQHSTRVRSNSAIILNPAALKTKTSVQRSESCRENVSDLMEKPAYSDAYYNNVYSNQNTSTVNNMELMCVHTADTRRSSGTGSTFFDSNSEAWSHCYTDESDVTLTDEGQDDVTESRDDLAQKIIEAKRRKSRKSRKSRKRKNPKGADGVLQQGIASALAPTLMFAPRPKRPTAVAVTERQGDNNEESVEQVGFFIDRSKTPPPPDFVPPLPPVPMVTHSSPPYRSVAQSLANTITTTISLPLNMTPLTPESPAVDLSTPSPSVTPPSPPLSNTHHQAPQLETPMPSSDYIQIAITDNNHPNGRKSDLKSVSSFLSKVPQISKYLPTNSAAPVYSTAEATECVGVNSMTRIDLKQTVPIFEAQKKNIKASRAWQKAYSATSFIDFISKQTTMHSYNAVRKENRKGTANDCPSGVKNAAFIPENWREKGDRNLTRENARRYVNEDMILTRSSEKEPKQTKSVLVVDI